MRQRGITLLESLLAIVVLAVAVVGMLGVQLRTLAETRTAAHRSQAIRLIEDLAERIKSNPGGFSALPSYVSDWKAIPAPVDCQTTVCSSAQLAQADLNEWKSNLQVLPGGQAKTFIAASGTRTSDRQLGVLIAWRFKERDQSKTFSKAVSIEEVVAESFSDTCPANFICHIAYVQP